MITLIPKHTHICTVPSSKSLSIRQLITAAIGDRQVRIFCPTISVDVYRCVECLKELGARITYTDHTYTVTPLNFGVLKEEAEINCGDAASVLRFLMPVTAALGIKTTFNCSAVLFSRPATDIVALLQSNGITVETGNNCYILSGKLESGEYRIDTSLSSQFASGLVLALPLLGESTVVFDGKRVSNSYLEMTLATLVSFGYKLEYNGSSVHITSKEPSHAVFEYDGDWSSGAYLLACGAVSDGITVRGLRKDSLQGDRKIIDILSDFGLTVECSHDTVSVIPSGKPIHGIKADCTDTPDIVPAIAAIAACAEGETVITGCDRLSAKESNRIKSITELCASAGIKTDYSDGTLTVYGGKINDCVIKTYSDHRIAMAAGIISYRGQGTVSADDILCTAKSYPDFIKTMFN